MPLLFGEYDSLEFIKKDFENLPEHVERVFNEIRFNSPENAFKARGLAFCYLPYLDIKIEEYVTDDKLLQNCLKITLKFNNQHCPYFKHCGNYLEGATIEENISNRCSPHPVNSSIYPKTPMSIPVITFLLKKEFSNHYNFIRALDIAISIMACETDRRIVGSKDFEKSYDHLGFEELWPIVSYRKFLTCYRQRAMSFTSDFDLKLKSISDLFHSEHPEKELTNRMNHYQIQQFGD